MYWKNILKLTLIYRTIKNITIIKFELNKIADAAVTSFPMFFIAILEYIYRSNGFK